MKTLIVCMVSLLFVQASLAQDYTGTWQKLEVGKHGRWMLTINGKKYQAGNRLAVNYKNLSISLDKIQTIPLKVMYQLGQEDNQTRILWLKPTEVLHSFENINY